MASRCLKPVQSLAANAGNTPVSLPKQEQIQGPENASIARFQGLCCYRIDSEIGGVFRVWAVVKTGVQAGFERLFKRSVPCWRELLTNRLQALASHG